MTPLQKDRFRNSEFYVEQPDADIGTIILKIARTRNCRITTKPNPRLFQTNVIPIPVRVYENIFF